LELFDRKKILINLLKNKGKLSFQQILKHFEDEYKNNPSDNPFKHKNTLNRTIKKLLNEKNIDFTTKDVPEPYKKQYFLTEEYYKRKDKESRDKSIEISNYIQMFAHKYKHRFEIFERIEGLENKGLKYSFISSCIAYFYKLEILNIENYDKYRDFITFIVLNHPDQKFAPLKKFFDFNKVEVKKYLKKYLKEFLDKKKIEIFILNKDDEFVKNNKFINNENTINILLKDDPIFQNLKKEIEIIFNYKFLILLGIIEEFENIPFDFLLQFGYSIFLDYLKNIKNSNILNFLKNFIMPFQIYLREFILEKLEINNPLFPFPLQTYENKRKFIDDLLIKPDIILTNYEIKRIKKYFELNLKSNNDKNNGKLIETAKNYIVTIIKSIENNEDFDKLIFMSRLLILIRIFMAIFGNQSFTELKRSLEKEGITISYSKLSDEFYYELKNYYNSINYKPSNEEKYFINYNLYERLDHLINIYKRSIENPENSNEGSEIKDNILDIFEFCEKILDVKQKLSFKLKKLELFLNFGNILINSEEIINHVDQLFEYPYNIYRLLEILIKIYIRLLEHESKIGTELNNKILNRIERIIKKFDFTLEFKIRIFEEYGEKMPYDFFDLLFNTISLYKFLYYLINYPAPYFSEPNLVKNFVESDLFLKFLKKHNLNHETIIFSLFLLLKSTPKVNKFNDLFIFNRDFLMTFLKEFAKFKKGNQELNIKNKLVKKLLEILGFNNSDQKLIKDLNNFYDFFHIVKEINKIEINKQNISEYKDLFDKFFESIEGIKNSKFSNKISGYSEYIGICTAYKEIYDGKIERVFDICFKPQSNSINPFLYPNFNNIIPNSLFELPYNINSPSSLQIYNILNFLSNNYNESPIPNYIQSFLKDEKGIVLDRMIKDNKDNEDFYELFTDMITNQLDISKIITYRSLFDRILSDMDTLNDDEHLFYLDLLLFNDFSFNSIETLRKMVLKSFKIYGFNWASRYLENYLNYVIYFYKIRYVDEIKIDEIFLKFHEFEKIIETIKWYIFAWLYWEKREAKTAMEYMNRVIDFQKNNVEKFNLIFNNTNKYPKIESNFTNLNKQLDKSNY